MTKAQILEKNSELEYELNLFKTTFFDMKREMEYQLGKAKEELKLFTPITFAMPNYLKDLPFPRLECRMIRKDENSDYMGYHWIYGLVLKRYGQWGEGMDNLFTFRPFLITSTGIPLSDTMRNFDNPKASILPMADGTEMKAEMELLNLRGFIVVPAYKEYKEVFATDFVNDRRSECEKMKKL